MFESTDASFLNQDDEKYVDEDAELKTTAAMKDSGRQGQCMQQIIALMQHIILCPLARGTQRMQ